MDQACVDLRHTSTPRQVPEMVLQLLLGF